MRVLSTSVAIVALATCSSACVPRLYSDTFGETDVTPCAWDPPTNRWPTSDPGCPEKEQGYAVGNVIPDFRLPDQHGDIVSLWQFSGLITVVDISTMWCAPCQELAESTEELYAHYRDEGVAVNTVLPQDGGGNPPDNADLNEWAEGFGITAPVIGDDMTWATGAVPDGQFPVLLIVGRDLVVRERVATISHEALEDAVDRALAE